MNEISLSSDTENKLIISNTDIKIYQTKFTDLKNTPEDILPTVGLINSYLEKIIERITAIEQRLEKYAICTNTGFTEFSVVNNNNNICYLKIT